MGTFADYLKARNWDVRTEEEVLQTYGTDWTQQFSVNPSAVVFPTTLEQVHKLVEVANREGVALVPSGGRTGLSGGAVASSGEVVVSLERMRDVGSVDASAQTVRVQAGVITQQLQQVAAQSDLFYPVDFASSGSSQIGGNIATNAGGIRVLRYGLTRRYVQGLTVVTGKGDVLCCGGLEKDATGYSIKDMMVGSEGTLGIVTDALIKLLPPPAPQQVLLLAIQELDSVMQVLACCQQFLTVSAFEYFDATCLTKLIQNRGLATPFNENYPFYVLCEFDENEADAMGAFERCLAQEWVVDGVLSQSQEQAEKLWVYREGISESLSYFRPYKNDISVPVSAIPAFMRKLQCLVSSHYPQVETAIFGHIGDGNLHLNILKPESWSEAEFVDKCEDANKDIFALIQSMQGSISAEHGVGQLKQPYLHYRHDSVMQSYLKDIKNVFDPNGVMNPGKLLR